MFLEKLSSASVRFLYLYDVRSRHVGMGGQQRSFWLGSYLKRRLRKEIGVMVLLAFAGYMVARMLGAAPVLADAIVEQLCAASDAAAQSHLPPGAQTEADAERLSAAVWHSIWPVERCARVQGYVALKSLGHLQFSTDVWGCVHLFGGQCCVPVLVIGAMDACEQADVTVTQ